jgi:hypothetical protein
MKDEITLQLEQLEKQKQELIDAAKKLEAQARYPDNIRRMREGMDKIIERNLQRNSEVQNLFNVLNANPKLAPLISLEYKEINVETSFKYYGVNPEDNIHETVQKAFIKTPWGAIDEFKDGKAQLDYNIAKRYQAYTYAGVEKKLLERIQFDAQKEKTNLDKQTAVEFWMAHFIGLYPDAEMVEGKKWVDVMGGRNSFEIDIIKISFPNKSWVEIRPINVLSYSIHSKYDSKFVAKSDEEIIQYLSL